MATKEFYTLTSYLFRCCVLLDDEGRHILPGQRGGNDSVPYMARGRDLGDLGFSGLPMTLRTYWTVSFSNGPNKKLITNE